MPWTIRIGRRSPHPHSRRAEPRHLPNAVRTSPVSRPDLDRALAPDDFRRFYWRKDELAAFCRAVGLSASGAKADVAGRVEHFLRTGERRAGTPARARGGRMPERFTPDTVVGVGWRCSQALRAFFQEQLGAGFHFDHVARALIHEGAGRTLAEVMESWRESRTSAAEPRDIAPQFEYNRHMRRFFDEHPGATREEARRSWHARKAAGRPPQPGG